MNYKIYFKDIYIKNNDIPLLQLFDWLHQSLTFLKMSSVTSTWNTYKITINPQKYADSEEKTEYFRKFKTKKSKEFTLVDLHEMVYISTSFFSLVRPYMIVNSFTYYIV